MVTGIVLLCLGLLGVICLLAGEMWLNDGYSPIEAFNSALAIVGVVVIGILSVVLIIVGSTYLVQGLFF